MQDCSDMLTAEQLLSSFGIECWLASWCMTHCRAYHVSCYGIQHSMRIQSKSHHLEGQYLPWATGWQLGTCSISAKTELLEQWALVSLGQHWLSEPELYIFLVTVSSTKCIHYHLIKSIHCFPARHLHIISSTLICESEQSFCINKSIEKI